jgi:antitoxin component YwqK of YwqJK toxin-antitoxin module
MKISNFNANLNSPTGYINLMNYIYTYSDDGKKIKESIENMNGVISDYSVFEYDHDQLARIKKYHNNALETYIVDQYDRSGRLEKESLFAADGSCLNYTIHTYSGSLQVGSDVYLAKNDEHYRSIKRTFDDNNNLITLESNELSMVSSMMSYVLGYKYFE